MTDLRRLRFGVVQFLANVNSHSRLLYAVICLSVVCNVHVHYSAS